MWKQLLGQFLNFADVFIEISSPVYLYRKSPDKFVNKVCEDF